MEGLEAERTRQGQLLLSRLYLVRPKTQEGLSLVAPNPATEAHFSAGPSLMEVVFLGSQQQVGASLVLQNLAQASDLETQMEQLGDHFLAPPLPEDHFSVVLQLVAPSLEPKTISLAILQRTCLPKQAVHQAALRAKWMAMITISTEMMTMSSRL